MTRALLCFFILLFNTAQLRAQSALCPDVEIAGAPQMTFPCVNGPACTTLVATYPDIRQTFDGANAYVPVSIPYAGHQPFQIPGATPILVNQDDVYSGVINLPFTFCFYGGQYNRVVVGANGMISFDVSYATNASGYSMCGGGLLGGSTPVPIPSTNSPYPRNAIFACFHDIDPSVSGPANKGIEVALVGQAPCRKLVVNWRNIPHFSCNSITSTFQCVLYENTNVIEMYVEKKPVCSSWNCGVAVIGVQNNARNQAVAAPGRNATVWTTTTANSEAWRFLPNGVSLLNSVQLLSASQTVIATGTSTIASPGVLTSSYPNVCVSGLSERYYVRANYTACTGGSLINTDSILLVRTPIPPAPTITSPVTYCQNAAPAVLSATGTNLKWYTTPTGGTGNAVAPVPSTTTAGTTSWYVSQTVNGCESPRAQIDVIVYATPPIPVVTNLVTYCQHATAAPLTATGSNLLWYTTPTGGTGIPTAPTPSTAALGTTTWYVSQTINGCEGPRASISVTIAPTTSGTATAQICPGSSYPFGSQTITAAGTYVDTFAAANSCDSIVTLTVTMNSIIQVNSNATICQGESYGFNGSIYTTGGSYSDTFTSVVGCDSITTLTLTVNPLPAAPTATSPITYCQNTAATALTATGSNLLWYTVPIGGTGDPAAPVPSTATPGTSTWYVSQTVNGCEGPRTPIVVTIYATPVAPIVTSLISYCQHETALPLTATGSNLLWYTTPTGGIGTATAPIPNTAIPGTTTWYVSQTINGCEGPRAAISVTVKPLPPEPVVSSPVTYCQNETAVPLTATGSNLLWYSTATGGTGTATAPLPNTVTPGTTTWYVSQTEDGCEGPRSQIDVTIYATPPLPSVTTPVTYCQYATASPLMATGNNLLWYTTAIGGAGDPVVPVPSTITPGITTWYVTQTINGCEGPRDSITVTIYATPPAPNVTTPVIYCQNVTAVPLVATGSNLLWYTAATGGTGTATAPTPSTVTAGTFTWYVSQTINGCEGPRAPISVTVKPTITGTASAQICPGASYPFGSQTITAAGTYVDTFAAVNGCDSIVTLTMIMNSIIQVNSSATICQGQSYTFNGNTYTTGGSYSDTFTSAVGCDSITTLTLTVTPLPSAPAVSPVTYCQNATAVPLTATGGSLLWYTTATGGTGTATAPTPSTTTPGTFTWYVSQTVNSCEGPKAQIDVTIYATPPVPNVTTPVTYCQNAGATSLIATGNNLLWYTTAVGGTGTATAPTPNTAIPGSTTWYVSQTINGCEGPRTSVDVTIYATPLLPLVTTPITYCQNVMAIPLMATGNNLLWYTTATGGTGTAAAPTPGTATPGTFTWYVSQTENGCEGPRASISVTVKPTTTGTAAAQICPGDSYAFGSQTITAAGTYTETFMAANGCDSVVTLTMIMNNIVQVNSNATICQGQSYTFNGNTYTTGGSYSDTFTSAVGCDSITTLTLTVTPLPSAPAVNPIAYCQNTTAVPLTATGANLLWYTAAIGGTGTATAPTPSTATPGIFTWYVSQTVNGCDGPRAQIDVTIYATPPLPVVTTPVIYCQSATAIPLTAAGNNLLWYTTATGGTGTATAPIPSTATPGTFTWYVSQTVNGCEGPRTQIDVTIYATPPLPTVTTPVIYCQNATAIPLTATGSNLLWYTTATGGTGTAIAPTPSTATPGTFTWYVSQTVNGCEGPRSSISVTVKPKTTGIATAQICPGASYAFGSQTITAAGTYTETFTATNGCDSVVTLTMIMNNIIQVNSSATICQGQSYTFNGNTYTTGGSYSDTFTSVVGCDSITTLNLTVTPLPAAPTVSLVTYCQNATAVPLTATGNNLLWYTTATGGTGTAAAPTPSTVTPGTFTWYVSQTINGCEGPRASISVTVKPTTTGTATAQICPGASYTFGSQTITAAGTYTEIFMAANGCDSVMTLTMIMNNIIQANSSATICQGQSYTFNGITYTTGGSYSDTFTSVVGCDSITTLTLTVTPLPAAPAVSPVTYCQNATAAPITATGSNLLWYTTATGGTSTATAPTPSTATPGTFTWYVSQTVNGCEGPRAQIDVTIYATPPLPTVTTPVIYCQNTTAVPLTATGNNLLWYTTATGGTGTATPPTPSTTTAGIFTWYVSQTINGCEGSRATISVTVKPTATGTASAQICPGASYPFGSQTITAAGTYTETFTAANGCDSVVTLTMIMNSIIQVNSNATICQGQSYTFNGNTYTTGGSYSDTFTSVVGCDSITTLTLTVTPLPSAPAVSPVTYCQNATTVPLTASGNNLLWYTTATGGTGTATAPTPSATTPGTTSWYVSQTVNGCEGPRAQIDVTIYATPPLPSVITPVTYCQNATSIPLAATGSSLMWYTTAAGGIGAAAVPTPSTTTPGTFAWYVSQTINGCEGPRTVITVVIHPTPLPPTVSPVTYCQGATTVALTATGTGLLWYTTATGGIGMATAPTPSSATPGTFTWYVSQTINGCEGPGVAIDVTIHPTPALPAVISPVTYCQNATAAPLSATGSNLLWYTNAAGGTGTATTPTPSTATPGTTTWYVSQTLNGCEGPRVAIDVVVHPLPLAPSVTTPVTYCQNAMPISLTATGNNLLWYTTATGGIGAATAPTPATTTPGTFTWYVSQTINSCEGPRATINVIVNPLPATPGVSTPVTYCQNETAIPLTATGNNLLWYTIATGGTGTAIAPTPSTAIPGTTTWYVSQSIDDCEGPRVAIEVVVYPIPPAPDVSPVNYCQGDPADPLIAGGSNLLWYTSATGGTGMTTAPVPSTAVVDTFTWYVSQVINGCESPRVPVLVYVHPYPTVDPKQEIVGSLLFLNARAGGDGLSYAWTPPGGLSCTGCPRPEADPETSTVYTISVTNAAGCTVSDTIGVHLTCARVFFPNTFTPNGDGNNDRFYPMGQSIELVKVFRIYNRWGELVYNRENIPANDESYGWDGTFQRTIVKPDAYVYYMEAVCKTGESIFLKGDVTLMR